MKTYCRGLVIDEEVVEQGLNAWLGSKAGKEKQHILIRRYGDMETVVKELTDEIRERRLTVPPIRKRTIKETASGKEREIGAPDAKHQVLDYILWWCLKDLFNDKLGRWQCSSIKGRGQLYAVRAIRRYRKEAKSKYFVKTDIRKFYQSCSAHHILDFMLPYIGSRDVKYLLVFLLSTYEWHLNIGSTICQWIATLVMSSVYHFIENEGWKTRRGKRIRLYSRQVHYMDDILLIGSSKRDLKMLVYMVKEYIHEKFGLEIKPWKVCLCDQEDGRGEPITMCGYRIWRDHVDVAKPTFVKARRAFASFTKSRSLKRAYRCVSYYGFLKNSDSYFFMIRNDIFSTIKTARTTISLYARRSDICNIRNPLGNSAV